MEKDEIDVLKAIKVKMITNGPYKGWLRTVGMQKFNLPDLELHRVPLFLGPSVMGIFNNICDYLLNSGKEVLVGQNMQVAPMVFVRFEHAVPPQDMTPDEVLNHYDHEVWTIKDIPQMEGFCEGSNHNKRPSS